MSPAGISADSFATEPAEHAPGRSGLVSGFRFAPGTRGEEISQAGAEAWLPRPGSGDEFIWLHFSSIPATTEWLRSKLDLPELFHELVGELSPSTRIELADEALVAVLNDVIYDFLHTETMQVAPLWLTLDRRVLISVRLRPIRSIDRLRGAVRAGETFPSPLSLLIHLMHHQGDVLADITRRTATRIDTIEDRLLSGRLDLTRATLGGNRRDLVRLQRLLAPEPGALFRMLGQPPAWVHGEDLSDLRQATEEFSTVLRDAIGLQERIKLLQEEIATRVSEQTSRSVFVLTAVTVMALPINIISGLFGMNVGGIPFSGDSAGFWTIAGFIFLVTAIAGWLLFRQREPRP